jgi:4-amino-4-deoxy-L-arabinose transferase-like glycosyltransferase
MKFLQKNNYLILLILIILLAAFLRFWRLPDYMTFLGDEGRDALAVKRMIVDHKFRLIGPVTSIGNMYLGPLYYYLILPAMVISRLSPVGPAAMVALLGIITAGLVFWFGQEWVGKKAALIAALFYALSPIVIIYSRSSWNPNVMPFFALIAMFGIWRVWRQRQFWWLPIIGLSLSFTLQSHWLGLLLFPAVFLFWLLTLIDIKKEKASLKRFWWQTLFLILIFLFLTVTPLVWFDLRHNFINANAFKAFFTNRQTTVNFKIYKAIPKIWALTTQIFTRLVTGKDQLWGWWTTLLVSLMVLGNLIWQAFKTKKWSKFLNEKTIGLIFLLVWFGVGLLGLGNYKQHIYDHYFGFFFPVPFLLTGWVLAKIWDYKNLPSAEPCFSNRLMGKITAAILLCFLVFLAVKESPLRYPPNQQLKRTQTIARFVLAKAQGEPFNLALLAERNYDEAYAFFMEVWGKPPLRIDPQKSKETIADQLFVICEQLPCQPVGHPKAEIAMFGWTKIAEKWQTERVEIYKLIHNR